MLISATQKLFNRKINQLNINDRQRISFTDEELEFANNLADSIIREKMKEYVHQTDNCKEKERWLTGILGELAVEKYFGINFIDTTVGNSKKYARPDLEKAGYNVGVKSCCYPNFPVINRNIKTPQLFILLNPEKNKALFLGLADMELLKENLSDPFNDNLIIMKAMLSRKTAFSKIEKLSYLNSIDELEKYKIA